MSRSLRAPGRGDTFEAVDELVFAAFLLVTEAGTARTPLTARVEAIRPLQKEARMRQE